MLKYSIVLQYILYIVFNVYIICKYLNNMNIKTVLTADQILKVIRSLVLECLLILMQICLSIVVILLTIELEIGNNTAWYIVKFLEENSVEAVPVNCLSISVTLFAYYLTKGYSNFDYAICTNKY